MFTQTGVCPAPLPAAEAVRTIVLGSASDTISIAGLDPEVGISGYIHDACDDFCKAIGGILQEVTGFHGTGGAGRPGGVSILTEVTASFEFNATTPGRLFGNMTRTHWDPDGAAVCVETYWIEGRKL